MGFASAVQFIKKSFYLAPIILVLPLHSAILKYRSSYIHHLSLSAACIVCRACFSCLFAILDKTLKQETVKKNVIVLCSFE